MSAEGGGEFSSVLYTVVLEYRTSELAKYLTDILDWLTLQIVVVGIVFKMIYWYSSLSIGTRHGYLVVSAPACKGSYGTCIESWSVAPMSNSDEEKHRSLLYSEYSQLRNHTNIESKYLSN